MGKKNKGDSVHRKSAPDASPNNPGDDSYLSFYELFTRDSTAVGSCGRSAGQGPVPVAVKSPFVDLCGSCPSKGDADACPGCAPETKAANAQEPAMDCGRNEEEPLPVPTEEERAVILAMDYETISQALRDEEPIAVAVATEYIVHYSLKVAEVLRNGEEYHHVVKPTRSTPVVEGLAMEIVRSSVAASLEQERLQQLGYGA